MDEQEPMAGGQMMGETMCEGNPRRNQTISSARRRQLMLLAMNLADQVEELTKPHERCVLRRMVESLIVGAAE